MSSKFGFLAKLNFLQTWTSSFVSAINPAIIHNIEKYYALKKVHYLVAIENLCGDYLEFGVYTGSSFAHSIRCYKSSSKLVTYRKSMNFIGFDSFEGFGELTEDDKHAFYQDENFETSYDRVYRRIKSVTANKISFKLVKGFFEDTVGKNLPSQYGCKKAAIVFIDSDTFSSAKTALGFCSSIIQEGTYLILDDYFSYKGDLRRGVCGAFNEFCAENKLEVRNLMNYGMGGAVFVVSVINK